MSFISTISYFISNGSDFVTPQSISKIIVALNLLNLLDTLIKVVNMSPLTCSNDISKESLSIIDIL